MDSTVRPARGMTILEVLLATALLGAIALTTFTAYLIGLRAAALAGGMNAATELAQEALVAATASSCGPPREFVPPALDDRRLARYRREVTIDRLGDSTLWELTVEVSWTQERRLRRVTIRTLRYVSASCAYLDH